MLLHLIRVAASQSPSYPTVFKSFGGPNYRSNQFIKVQDAIYDIQTRFPLVCWQKIPRNILPL